MGTILTKLWDSVHRDGQLNARQNRLFLNSLKGNDRTYGTRHGGVPCCQRTWYLRFY